jgi:hypothetical protein
VSPPVGPTGLALECGGEGGGDQQPRRFRAGADFGGVRTTLAFTGDRDAALDELSLVGRLELLVQPRLTVFAGAGSIVGGTVRLEGTEHQMLPGIVAMAGLSWLAVTETARRPFVLASAVLGFAATHTRVQSVPVGFGQQVSDTSVPWRAGDGRIGLAAGKSFGRARPYAVARVFGGPVSWQFAGESIAGTDRHHYQAGAGLALDLPGHLDATVEAIPLGERALALGAGYRF